jgi:hypothetical protein
MMYYALFLIYFMDIFTSEQDYILLRPWLSITFISSALCESVLVLYTELPSKCKCEAILSEHVSLR